MLHRSIDINGAQLQLYIIQNTPEIASARKRPCVLICPGGAYATTSDREAEPIALQFLAADISCAVLRYSVAPKEYPAALIQLAKAVAYLRANAEEFALDSEKILVFGGSAGGHLAASLGVFWNHPFMEELCGCNKKCFKPNGLLLAYPVLTGGAYTHEGTMRNLLGEQDSPQSRQAQSLERFVNEDTPKTFLWHTANDDAVPVENSLLFAAALSHCHIPFELHIYPYGRHGLALASQLTGEEKSLIIPHCQDWIEKAIEFVQQIGETPPLF